MVLHGSAWLFLTLGSAAQSPGSARLSLALLDSWIGTVLFFFLLLLWLLHRRGLRLLLHCCHNPLVLHGSPWLFLTLGLARFFSSSCCCCGLFIDEVSVFFFTVADTHSWPSLLIRSSLQRASKLKPSSIQSTILLWQLMLILLTPVASLTDTCHSRAALHPRSSLQPDRSSLFLRIDRVRQHVPSIGMQPIPSLSPSASIRCNRSLLPSFHRHTADLPFVNRSPSIFHLRQPTSIGINPCRSPSLRLSVTRCHGRHSGDNF